MRSDDQIIGFVTGWPENSNTRWHQLVEEDLDLFHDPRNTSYTRLVQQAELLQPPKRPRSIKSDHGDIEKESNGNQRCKTLKNQLELVKESLSMKLLWSKKDNFYEYCLWMARKKWRMKTYLGA
ncbi:hypothetical protein PPACK8108_LOCUS20736 [Phakopsora pachyrhizi]|uniref:Uncharacterized protein n=1 Tax=Phakopsora pachyrhizi TaxID=170000 RepID=A0AAV0BII1_PHAPC|nr:hypothetical protein PPACK8108_LOCUS20736 [Phakopsora pachyrhizi]